MKEYSYIQIREDDFNLEILNLTFNISKKMVIGKQSHIMQRNSKDGDKFVLPIKYKLHFTVKMAANPHNIALNCDSDQKSKYSLYKK